MKKVKLFASFFTFLVAISCSTIDPKYREGEPQSDFNFPTNKEIEKSFYLLGDGGYSPPGGSSLGLLAFKSYLDSVKQTANYTIFLGDNIYPDGMPPEDAPHREAAEYRLDAQLDAIENYNGKVVVIPGNHDWYSEKLEGLERQKNYLKKKFEDILVWSPEIGCGLESLEISDNIQLIVIDSQWYLEDWDKNPKINDNCEQIKTREAMFLELESEIKKNQNKTVLIALHHPIYTNGVHGGQYTLDRHIYPSQKKIPLPILGSLATLIRTTGGVSIQDAQNNRYKSLASRLTTIVQGYERVVFVSGHEHSLQYIEHEGVKQIVSGSGSKASYATLSNDGLFAYPGQGFAVLDVFKDGSVWVSFYGNENNKPKLLYQKEILKTPVPFELEEYPDSFPDTIKTSIYKDEDVSSGSVHKTIWGERYRKLYGTEVTLPVANLDTLYGGLEVVREGGGHQTVSLRVKDSLGREYNIRRVRKDALRFLQSVAFKNQPIESKLENTVAENLLTDFYTAAHPYGFLTIPELSKAVGVYHTNPKVFYLPKQEALGKYNSVHGDDVYMIVERPEEGWKGYESFGRPDHDIVSTADMLERLRRDEKYILDESAYVRARIFDMLIGDWDRHQDQWRWAEIEKDEKHIFRPIPRDRDQVYSNFDGAFFGTLRALTGFANQFAVYGENIKDVEWFNIAAMGLDRSLLQNTGKETWIEQARFIKENLSDAAIEKAFAQLPEETRGEATQELIKNVKGRRNNLVDIATRYYQHLAHLAIVTGTDKDDFIDVERLKDGNTRVIITRNKDGARAEILSNKIYKKEETEEIWIYGLDDDDKIFIEGEGESPIFVRLIGGQDHDVYTINNGKNLKVYDHKSLKNTVINPGGGKIRLTDNYEINTYDKDKKTFSSGSITPGAGYNPDDGFSVGLRYTKTINKFKRNPFTSSHSIYGEVHSATNGFMLEYEAEFASIVGNYNLLAGVNFKSPDYSQNFFGYGNETFNNDEEFGLSYNRVGISEVGVKAGLVNNTPFGSFFGLTASFEGIKVEASKSGYFAENFSAIEVQELVERKYFAGVDAMYKYESYDDELVPTRGMLFELNLGFNQNTSDLSNQYGYFKPYMGFYNALTRNRKLVLKTRAQAHINIGKEFEFYQAARLGANTGLRGYRQERFAGKSAFGTGADLRYSFNTISTSFLPFQLGVYGGYDLGRVWTENNHSNLWHDSYGGGLWINSADAIQGKISVFAGDEGARFQFALGLTF